MDKLGYIVKTLSRTRRKDYENYVVNAVWQRLGDTSLKPVTQQLVRCAGGRRRFIDLYFPQVQIGIECDEAYHGSSAQRDRDEARTIELVDAIRQIDEADYTQLRVETYGKTLEEVDARIDEIVGTVRAALETLRGTGRFEEWRPGLTAAEALAGQDTLSVRDDVGFATIAETCNTVLGCDYRGMQRAYFHPAGLKARGIDARAWFPKLSVDGTSAAAGGWVNTLSADGMRIFEANAGADMAEAADDGKRRIVFAQTLDRITGERLYRFVGQFEYTGLGENASGATCKVYHRVSDEWAIVR